MTATRAPVQWAARWLARLEAAAPMIKMGSLVMTGISTMLMVLKQYGYGQYAGLLLVIGVISGIAFVKVYSEGGVYNQQKRDIRDLGLNHAAPNQRIDDEINAKAITAGQKGRSLTAEERDAIENELDRAFSELRDGIDISQVDGRVYPDD